MSTDMNVDTLSEEEQVSLFDALATGDFSDEEVNNNQEDTELDSNVEDDTETDEQIDDEALETDDSETEEEDEDALNDEEDDIADTYEEEDDDESEGDESEDEDSETETVSEDTDTEDSTDETESENTEEPNYKEFYETLTKGTIKVNGKEISKFKDPEKFLKAVQMAGGFSSKMAGFKKHRPYLKALEERKLLEDQDKFNLAMNIIDGDKEAIKAHLKSLDIDPFDLELDTINYDNKSTLPDQATLVVEEVLETAENLGVKDELISVVGKQWDDESYNEFIGNPHVQQDLLDHLKSGAYDKVQSKIEEIKITDINGGFSSMSSIDQYRYAVNELQQELKSTHQQSVEKVEEVKNDILEKRKEQEYIAKAAKQESKVANMRKKAASVSKKKTRAKQSTKFDPLKVEGKDLDDLMNFLIEGSRS